MHDKGSTRGALAVGDTYGMRRLERVQGAVLTQVEQKTEKRMDPGLIIRLIYHLTITDNPIIYQVGQWTLMLTRGCFVLFAHQTSFKPPILAR